MRGFRASRAFQNFKSARFGKQPQHHPNGNESAGSAAQAQHASQRPELPAWLRMPAPGSAPLVTTRASSEKPVKAVKVAKTEKPSITMTKKPLRLVASGTKSRGVAKTRVTAGAKKTAGVASTRGKRKAA